MTITAQQIQNVKLGSCNVTYGTRDMGLTKGGVMVTIAMQSKAINVDQFGQTVVNDYIMGRTATVKVPMAETDLSKLVAGIAGASLVVDKTTASKTRLIIPTAVGTSLVSIAQNLLLHPTAAATGDVSEDVNCPLAAPTGNISFSFQAENERVYEVDFTVYPDPGTGLLLTIGDLTATAI